jgi:predicted MFS family arabinose efflux permease
LGQHLGWRACLQLIGLAGIPFALLILLTVREPPRLQHKQAVVGEPTRAALGALRRRPAYIHLVLALSLSALTNFGLGQWIPTFMMRSYGLSMAEVGAYAGLAAAVGSVLGLLGGGLSATWLGRRDRRWELWIPAIAMGSAFPFALLIVATPFFWVTLVGKTLLGFLSSISAGVAIAAVQSFAESNRRATAVALVLFLQSILGHGLGPYLIGLASDLLQPQFGIESLRYAMLFAAFGLLWSMLHFLLAARRSEHDRVD